MGEGKFFVIRSQLNGMVLDVQDNCCTPGNPVATWHYNGGPNQLFYEDPVTCCIRSALDDNYCLELQGDRLVVNLCSDHESNQKWCCSGDAVRNRDTDQVLDIADHNTEPGARVCAWSYNGGPNQQWTFEYQAPRYFYIKNEATGKALDIADNNPNPGASVVMWDFHGNDNQQWYEDRNGAIRSKMNDLCIDLSSGEAQMMPYTGSSAQLWVKQGSAIVSRNDPGTCLDIHSGSTENGAKICQWGYKGSDNQHLYFEYL